MIAQVLVELKAKGMDQTFSYHVNKELENEVVIGKRVLVPFANRKLEGFVLKLESDHQLEYNLKDIISVIDSNPVLNQELLQLGNYISKKTLTSLIYCYQAMLPSALKAKQGFFVNKKYISYIRLLNHNYDAKTKPQKKIIDLLKDHDYDKKELQTISVSSLNTLLKKKVIEEYKIEQYRLNDMDNKTINRVTLTFEQQDILNKVTDFNHFKPYLLFGVTGSGKTEVYMRLIENVLKEGKEAIVLVPEISLTPQFVTNFRNRFGNRIAILHSRLSDGEKYDEWRKIERKEVSIAIGARSAIFAPFTNLGIIVVDEEHTMTYKQENNPKYHAIDIALYRGKYHACPVILGSATPSIESFTRAKLGIYELLTLKNRVNHTLPKVELVDMKEEIRKGNSIISELLQEQLNHCLEKKEQAIILLNRRGYSTTVVCHDCGYKVVCPNCDIALTYHKKTNAMKCHYCNYVTYKPLTCPECSSKHINEFGLGTEKLVDEVQKIFPNSRIIRMDIDTTARKGSHEKIIRAFEKHEYDILIGTQMIAKGLNFDNVTLVGVIQADSSLNIPDFRSAERTFNLLNQVAGRAGRSQKEGLVIFQGFNLDHYSIVCASNHDYLTFYNEEIKIRKKLNYPPYCNLICIKIMGLDINHCLEEGNKITYFIKNKFLNKITILGPTMSSIPKINNKYYVQIVIKHKNTRELYPILNDIKDQYRKVKRISIDIDMAPLKL